MADVTKTIKPAGGGDYTSLQSFETAAEAEATDQWLGSCFRGSLGSVIIAAYTATGAEAHISVAAGEQHNGKTDQTQGDTAFISVTGSTIAVSFVVGGEIGASVQGLRIEHVNGSGVQNATVATGTSQTILDDLLVIGTGTGEGIFSGGAWAGGTPTLITVRNCIVQAGGTATNAIRFRTAPSAGSGTHSKNYIYNTSIQLTGTITNGFKAEHVTQLGATSYPDTWCYNVAICDKSGGSAVCFLNSSATTVITASNNLSSDTTAFGTSAQTSKAQADTFTSTDDFKTRKTGSALSDNGTDLSATAVNPFSDDADGTSRPVGSAWDIGAYEVAEIAGQPMYLRRKDQRFLRTESNLFMPCMGSLN